MIHAIVQRCCIQDQIVFPLNFLKIDRVRIVYLYQFRLGWSGYGPVWNLI